MRDRCFGPIKTVNGLGTNPTFGDNAVSLEVFVFDFDGDLYDREVRVEFVERLRGEKRFDSAEELAAEMTRDVARARQILAAGVDQGEGNV